MHVEVMDRALEYLFTALNITDAGRGEYCSSSNWVVLYASDLGISPDVRKAARDASWPPVTPGAEITTCPLLIMGEGVANGVKQGTRNDEVRAPLEAIGPLMLSIADVPRPSDVDWHLWQSSELIRCAAFGPGR